MISTTNTTDVYLGDGLTTHFPITFAFADADVVKVSIYDIESGKTTVLDSDYYVDTVSKQVNYPGYPPGEEPAESEQPEILPVGKKLVVYRETPADQLENLGPKHPLYIIEKMIDKNLALIQELKETIERTVKVSTGSEVKPDELVQEIFNSSASASSSALAASASATEAADSAKAAEDSESAAALSEASAAEILADIESAAATVGVIATVFDIHKRYEPPALVMVENGDVYRCIHTSQGEHPALSSNWVIAAIGQKGTFERDENGDLMPCKYAQASANWQTDEDGNIYPAPLYKA